MAYIAYDAGVFLRSAITKSVLTFPILFCCSQFQSATTEKVAVQFLQGSFSSVVCSTVLLENTPKNIGNVNIPDAPSSRDTVEVLLVSKWWIAELQPKAESMIPSRSTNPVKSDYSINLKDLTSAFVLDHSG